MASAPDRPLVAAPPRLTVVVPAHNEEPYLAAAVRTVLGGLRERGTPFEVVVVENGSTDRTSAVASELARSEPEVRALQLRRADYGAALRSGFRAARGELVANVDVDLVDLGFLDRAIAVATDDSAVDVVIGTKRGVGASDDRALGRRAVTEGFSLLMHYGFGLRVSDTHGLKLLRAERVRGLVDACGQSGDLFDTELVLRAERAGLRLVEIPVQVAEQRPPRTPIASRVPRTLAGLVRLRVRLGPPGAASPAPRAALGPGPAAGSPGEDRQPALVLQPAPPPLPGAPRGAALGVASPGMERGPVTDGARDGIDESLRSGIDRLVATLEELAARLAPLDDLAARVEELTHGLQLLDPLPEQVEALAGRLPALEQLAGLAGLPAAVAQLHDRVATLGDLPARLAGLDDRMEAAVAGVRSELAADREEQRDALATLRDELRAVRRRIPARARRDPALDEAALAGIADAVAARLSAPSRQRQPAAERAD